MLPQEEICIVGLLERKKKNGEKKNCTSVVYVRRGLQELAAQEELARFYPNTRRTVLPVLLVFEASSVS